MKRIDPCSVAASCFCSLTLFLLVSTTVVAQDEPKRPNTWGVEYDLMAPRIGAWNSFNVNGYFGQGRVKHSLMVAHINVNNNHLTEESFKKDDFSAFGYRVELFSHHAMKRWGAGFMLVYSINDVITTPNLQEGRFTTLLVGVPLGYTWVLWKHLTLNPNVSILVPLTNRTVKIGIDEVQQAPWGLEPGIRIGYRW